MADLRYGTFYGTPDGNTAMDRGAAEAYMRSQRMANASANSAAFDQEAVARAQNAAARRAMNRGASVGTAPMPEPAPAAAPGPAAAPQGGWFGRTLRGAGNIAAAPFRAAAAPLQAARSAVGGAMQNPNVQAVIPTAVGALASSAIRTRLQEGANGAPQTPVASNGPGQIPNEYAPGFVPNPGDVIPQGAQEWMSAQHAPTPEPGLFNQGDWSRTLGNALMASSPGRGMVNGVYGGLRQGGAALGTLARAETPGAAVAQAVTKAGQIAKPVVQAARGAAAVDNAPVLTRNEPVMQPARDPNVVNRPIFSDARFEAEAGRNPAQLRDFSRELASVPKDLPSDLPENKIYKTKGPNGETIYSGRNVKEGADIVDGSSNKLPDRGGYMVGNGSAGYQADLRTLAILRSQNAAAEAAVPTGGVTDMGGRKGTTMMDDLVAKGRAGADLRGMSPRAQAHYLTQQAALDKQSQIAQMQNATALRGQDVGAATSRYGTDVGAATSRYGTDVGANVTMRGQDMHLQGQMLPMQQQLRTMQLHQLVAQQANGDMRKAAALAASYGLDPAHFTSVASAQDAGAKNSAEAVERAVRPYSVVTDKDGKQTVSDGMVAQRTAELNKIAPGFNELPIGQQAQAAAKVDAALRLRQGFDDARGEGLLQKFGLAPRPANISAIPDVKGYTFKRLGKGENLDPMTFTNMGDYEGTHPTKPSLRLKDTGFGDHGLAELQRLGAVIGQ